MSVRIQPNHCTAQVSADRMVTSLGIELGTVTFTEGDGHETALTLTKAMWADVVSQLIEADAVDPAVFVGYAVP